jgi:gas vesicle protein
VFKPNKAFMSGSQKFLGGLLVGTAVGIVTGLLIAPTSGSQTRRTIVSKSKTYSQQAIDAVRQYLENIKMGKIKGDTALTNKESEELLNRLKSIS